MIQHDIADDCRGDLFRYLGHFRNPIYLRQGHNDGGGVFGQSTGFEPQQTPFGTTSDVGAINADVAGASPVAAIYGGAAL